MNRRNFIGALIAAPAIVRASSLMPVTRIWTPLYYFDGIHLTMDGSHILARHLACRDILAVNNEFMRGDCAVVIRSNEWSGTTIRKLWNERMLYANSK